MIASDGSTISCRYSYDPFGRRTKVSGSIDCDFGFTGYYFHATSGLDLSATRPYDSNLGRFIQRDPLAEAAGLNLYAYCGGNPVCGLDPSGLATILPGQFPGDPDPFPTDFPPYNPNAAASSCVDSPPMDPLDPFGLDPLANPNFSGNPSTASNINGPQNTGSPLLTARQASFAAAMAGYVSAFATALRFIMWAAIITDPVALGAVGIAGVILVGVELYDANEQGERSDEGKGPVFQRFDGRGDWYPYGDGPPRS